MTEPQCSTEPSTSQEDCCICLEPISLKLVLPCKHPFCYLCLKTNYQRSSHCPLCRGKIPSSVFDNAQLSSNEVPRAGETWCYSGRNGGWWSYEPSLAAEIESAYKQSEPMFKFNLLSSDYCIDFGNMIQIQMKTGAKRKVKRVDAFNINMIKGIAGLKLHEPQNSNSAPPESDSDSDESESDDDSN